MHKLDYHGPPPVLPQRVQMLRKVQEALIEQTLVRILKVLLGIGCLIGLASALWVICRGVQ